MPKPLLLPCCALAFAAAAASQSGRTMRLNAPAVIGQTASIAMEHPIAAAGNLYLLLWSPPFAHGVSLSVPGLTVNGLVRVDLANAIPAKWGVLANSGMAPDLLVPIPNDPLLVGYAWDLQGVDLTPANVLTLADDDLPIVVSAPPLPSANLVPIAPGTFPMGSSVTPWSTPPYYNQSQSQPVHQVAITRPIWIGRFEVTQAEYQAVMGVNPSFFQAPANRPVEQVSWHDAMAFCASVTAFEAAAGRLPSGYQYRLPTEAEWEYCCRAGTTTEFNYGPSLVCGQANMQYSYHTNSFCSQSGTAVVGSFAANPWGLFDMHGNVWEWCLDAWDGSANYPSAAAVDPLVSGSPTSSRAYRGGGWLYGSHTCRSAFRGWSFPGGRSSSHGFRVVLGPVLAP